MEKIEELNFVQAEIVYLKNRLNKLDIIVTSIKDSMYRDMADRWQFINDAVCHPMTGKITPEQAEKILFDVTALKCRGN